MKKINGEIVKALEKECGIAEMVAKEIIIAVATGKIPHSKISY